MGRRTSYLPVWLLMSPEGADRDGQNETYPVRTAPGRASCHTERGVGWYVSVGARAQGRTAVAAIGRQRPSVGSRWRAVGPSEGGPQEAALADHPNRFCPRGLSIAIGNCPNGLRSL